jgi:hypothetical protein
MEFLGGEQREAIVEVEAHLVSKDAHRSCSCTVAFLRSFRQDSV